MKHITILLAALALIVFDTSCCRTQSPTFYGLPEGTPASQVCAAILADGFQCTDTILYHGELQYFFEAIPATRAALQHASWGQAVPEDSAICNIHIKTLHDCITTANCHIYFSDTIRCNQTIQNLQALNNPSINVEPYLLYELIIFYTPQ